MWPPYGLVMNNCYVYFTGCLNFINLILWWLIMHVVIWGAATMCMFKRRPLWQGKAMCILQDSFRLICHVAFVNAYWSYFQCLCKWGTWSFSILFFQYWFSLKSKIVFLSIFSYWTESTAVLEKTFCCLFVCCPFCTGRLKIL